MADNDVKNEENKEITEEPKDTASSNEENSHKIEEPKPFKATVDPSKMRKVTTSAEENAKYTLTPEPRMGYSQFTTPPKARSKYRKRKQMLPIIAILCGIIAIGTVILSNVVKNLAGNGNVRVDNYDATVTSTNAAKPTPSDGLVIPTPDPEEGEVREPSIVIAEKKEEHEEKYKFIVSNVSWTEAKEAADREGGHLATISSQEELDEIVTLAMINDCSYVWVGCHRENDTLIWENSEENIEFYVWGKGEPSKYDSGDNVTEDYLLLWKNSGEWVYNDSRNDPYTDYKDMYGGKLGYVIEFED